MIFLCFILERMYFYIIHVALQNQEISLVTQPVRYESVYYTIHFVNPYLTNFHKI